MEKGPAFSRKTNKNWKHPPAKHGKNSFVDTALAGRVPFSYA